MPKKILVADDSVTIHKVVELILADEDFSVTSVHNGKDALSRLSEIKFDVFLADIDMPPPNGFELASHVNENLGKDAMPVVLMASAFDTIDEGKVASSGAAGYIKKPFEAADLLSKLESVLGSSQKRAMAKDFEETMLEENVGGAEIDLGGGNLGEFPDDYKIDNAKDDIEALLKGLDGGEGGGAAKENSDSSAIDINDLLSGVMSEEDASIAETSFMEKPAGAEEDFAELDILSSGLTDNKSDVNKSDFDDIERMLAEASTKDDDADLLKQLTGGEGDTGGDLDDLLKEPVDTDRILKAPVDESVDNLMDGVAETSLIEGLDNLGGEEVSIDLSLDALKDEPAAKEDIDLSLDTFEEPVEKPKKVVREQRQRPARPVSGSPSDHFLSKSDLLEILQAGVDSKVDDILSILDNDAIIDVLRGSFKEFITESFAQTAENFKDLVTSAINARINSMLERISLEDILNQIISSTINGIFREFDGKAYPMTKEIIERYITQTLEDKLIPLRNELQEIVWERLPEIAENIIKREIETIKSDTIN